MPSVDSPKPHLDIQALRYFRAFVREGTVLGAAKSLHLTQPTLSRQLINLEKQVGAPLYVKEGRHVKLTEKGRVLLRYAESVVDLVEEAERELSSAGSQVSGGVFIGHGEPAAMRIVTMAMMHVLDRYPDVQFHLFTGSTGDLFERLDTGLLDFIVESEVVGRPGYRQLMMPVSDTWGVVMCEDDPLALRTSILPSDLEGRPILCSRQVIKAGVLRDWAGDSFDKMRQVATFNAGSSMINMLSLYGMAYAFTYEDQFRVSGSQGLCFRPLDPPTESECGIVWKKARDLSAAASAFLESVEELCRESA
ncbi:MAG TPA: LysR family transcriptional regulator [Candidatus Rubneribacter avistercoris]|nr:LysR family transcriptional regulator [Candidatus Rubneribacter avistercoris]